MMPIDDVRRRPPDWFVPVWGTAGAVLTIAGALFQTDATCAWNALFWSNCLADKLPALWGNTVPLALGLVSLVTLAIRRGRTSGESLTIPVAAALLSYLAASLSSLGRGAFCALLGMLIGASLIVAGSHATRFHPDRKLPRGLAGIGGVLLSVPFFLRDADMHGNRILENLVRDSVGLVGVIGGVWSVSVFAWFLLTLGFLGLCFPSTRPPSKIWTRAISLLAHLLLLAFPFVLYHNWWDRNSGYASMVVQPGDPLYQAWMENWAYRDLMTKFWLLGSGHTILLSTGIAAWTDATLSRHGGEHAS